MANIEKAAVALDRHLRAEEGERLEPYLCDAGVPTIGVGATTYLDGRKVRLSDPAITVDQMNRMLQVEVDRYLHAILEMIDGECGTNQLVALAICAYNIGLDGMRGSTMIRQHKAGNFEAAARAFMLWNKYRPKPGAPLVEHKALTARRLREAAIYMAPDSEATALRPPQAVASESKLTASPIAQGGAITAGTGILAGAAQVADQINEHSGTLGTVKTALATVKDFVHGVADFVGVPPGALLALVMIGAGVIIINYRRKQRAEGWA